MVLWWPMVVFYPKWDDFCNIFLLCSPTNICTYLMFAFVNRDPFKISNTAEGNELMEIALINALFHITWGSTDMVTYLITTRDNNYNIQFPSKWQLFRDEDCLCEIVLIGTMSLSLNRPEMLTLIAEGHIDKALFDFTQCMEIRRVQ